MCRVADVYLRRRIHRSPEASGLDVPTETKQPYNGREVLLMSGVLLSGIETLDHLST